MRKPGLSIFLGAIVLALLATLPASADSIPVMVTLTVTYNPPSGQSFSTFNLQGNAQVFQVGLTGGLVTVAAGPGPQNAPGTTITFALSGPGPSGLPAVQLGSDLFFSFNGTLCSAGPGPSNCPDSFFAFPAGTTSPALPSSAPVIDLGSFVSAGPGPQQSLTASGPLFAFSAGTQVGTWKVEVQKVPEPSTFTLLGPALLGLGLLRAKFWLGRN